MPKIIDPDLLVVGTELSFNLPARTFTLNLAGNLGVQGVSLQFLYSKFKELWQLPTYQMHPFPMYTIDSEAGKYQFGTDGSLYSGWAPANDATRNLLRDGGWDEYSATAVLLRVYAGIKSPAGSVLSTEQLYFQRIAGSAGIARNFNYLGPVNEGVQVYGNAANGAFDERAYFKVFAHAQGRTRSEKTLADGDYTASGPRLLNFFVATASDAKIVVSDATIAASLPYTGIIVTYYTTDQNRSPDGTARPYRVVITGNSATAEQIYAKVQYLLRQSADMDSGPGTVPGQTAGALLSFVGDTLVTGTGVYIDGFNPNDTNRITFTDNNAVPRTFPYKAGGSLVFNANLSGDTAATYRLFFQAGYGTAAALTVKNFDGNDIAGTVSGVSSLSFDYAYDSNVQRGAGTAATDAPMILVGIGLQTGKFVSTLYTLTRATGQNIALVAERDRSYANPV